MIDKDYLQKIVDDYGDCNEQVKKLKKGMEDVNHEIKTIMCRESLDDFTTDKFVAKYQVIKKKDFDEDKLLGVVKSKWKEEHGEEKNPYIKTVEVLDIEALTKAVYAGDFDVQAVKDCEVITETERLTVSVKKS